MNICPIIRLDADSSQRCNIVNQLKIVETIVETSDSLEINERKKKKKGRKKREKKEKEGKILKIEIDSTRIHEQGAN